MSFSMNWRMQNSKIKLKPEPEVVIGAILRKNRIGRSICQLVTLWTAAVDWKLNCYAPANRLRSR